ncbi:LytTR family DNA-binding domain-containing protein [Caulobacter soli]|uniref:LytTR family DNA-binding domain-containing protein n=1 Tax=Caulobacter soli TaxID=2708539 RepID=UPI001FECC5EA|nr:LytTR family DNA-binding domain-containing protein [Caulobacter soli]
MARAEPLLGSAREWAIDFAVAITVGVFVGVIGPYGSYLNGAPGPRVFHFVVCFCVGTLIFGVLQRLAVAGAERWKLPVWPVIILALLVGCLPLALFISWLATTLWPFLIGRITLLEWYGQCVFLSGPILSFVVVRRMLKARRREPIAPSAAPAVLPPSGEVLCLRMEDHYVRVHTPGGSRLVTGPFERVIAGMAHEGMRVHRSWWVARAAVTGVVADGRNLRLTLRGDLAAPVSRASVARLRAAGWLAPEPPPEPGDEK